MVSLIWTTLQMLLASFFISFAEVGLHGRAGRQCVCVWGGGGGACPCAAAGLC
jgi:hypothetical protein